MMKARQTASVWGPAIIAVALVLGAVPSEGNAQSRLRQDSDALQHSRPQAATKPAQTAPLIVIVDEGKLSVTLWNAKFPDVMETIAKQSGIEIHLLGDAGQTTLSESFAGLPLEEGLLSLLRGKDFALVYSGTGSGRRVVRVIINPSAESGPYPGRAGAAGGPPESVASSPPSTVPLPALQGGMTHALRSSARPFAVPPGPAASPRGPLHKPPDPQAAVSDEEEGDSDEEDSADAAGENADDPEDPEIAEPEEPEEEASPSPRGATRGRQSR